MSEHPEGSLARRLWIYQAERFPLVKTSALVAVFVAANINVAAGLSDWQNPSWPVYAVAWLVTMIFFFQMRAADEIKDLEDDRRYRPERPIPRGLVSLWLIVGIAAGLAVVAIAAASLLHPVLRIFVGLVWIWLALMTVEFFVPRWLKARPFLYLGSHMLIIPLIALFVVHCEWTAVLHNRNDGSSLLLGLSFLNGCVLEIGRKLYAPENERLGVETYSALLGVKWAAVLWMACVILSEAILVQIAGWFSALSVPVIAASTGALTVALAAAARYLTAPTPRSQKHVELAAALWVFVSYAVAAYTPLLAPT